MLPLVIPGLVTVGLFAFLAAWNEFFAAFILLTKQSSFSLPIMLLSPRDHSKTTVALVFVLWQFFRHARGPAGEHADGR